jgi:hypothetical protein
MNVAEVVAGIVLVVGGGFAALRPTSVLNHLLADEAQGSPAERLYRRAHVPASIRTVGALAFVFGLLIVGAAFAAR